MGAHGFVNVRTKSAGVRPVLPTRLTRRAFLLPKVLKLACTIGLWFHTLPFPLNGYSIYDQS
jgi:hypothetical protein